ncbi:MAG: insulinase family protein [Gemmatimonadetes bacterium]|nr:insulinase family protein [Gemmatimonadota bacterium]
MTIRSLLRIAAVTLAAGCAPAPAPPPTPAPAVPAPAPPAPRAEAAVAPFPTTPPALGPVPALRLPAPVRRTLGNGLQVVYVRHGAIPVVHATLLVPAGSVTDPANLPGLAAFTAEMLDEGAGGRSALALSGALDLLGATLTATAGWDATSVDLNVLRDRFPQALALMADVVARPDFPQAEIVRVRDERITQLTSARDVAGTIAGNAFSALVFGPAHPYGRLPAVESTRRIARNPVKAFHDAHYRPAGSTLILVGDVDPEQLHPLVERALGAWAGSANQATPPAAAALPAATRIVVIDKPAAPQSEIRIGHRGVARSHPDYFPLIVMNTILGGSFTSRLNTNLREVHGFSYGVSSSFGMRRGPGPFLAGGAVVTAKTDSAVAEFLREIRRMRDEPVPTEELQKAKNNLALGLPADFETSADVARQLAQIEIYGLPADFYNQYVPRVLAVTAADVQRVAREYLQPERSVVVVVGDRRQLLPGLRALNVGSVESRESSEFVR